MTDNHDDDKTVITTAPAPRLQKIVRLADLTSYVGLRRTQVESLISQGRFPKPIRISDRAMGWMEGDLIAWQQARIAERDGTSAKSESAQ